MKKFALFMMVSVIALWSLSSPQCTPKSTASKSQSLFAQYDFETCSVAPPTEWNKTYGGIGPDNAWGGVVQTNDGGYALAGNTMSYAAGDPGPGDAWLVKTDANGNLLWYKTYEGGGCIMDLVHTSDGGYALSGDGDYHLVKTDSVGNKQWNKTYDIGRVWSAIQTNDGGYALAGSFQGNASLVKTDSVGNKQWNKRFGTVDVDEQAYSVVQTSDGGYVLAGTQEISMHAKKALLVKTDSAGNKLWDKLYSEGSGGMSARSVVVTRDGGYALAGYLEDFWLGKTDSAGNLMWNKTYEYHIPLWGGPAWSLVQTNDGGYALAGRVVTGSSGDRDIWFVKTDSFGNHMWNKTYGGMEAEQPAFTNSLVQTNDGGYAIAGITNSSGAGDHDAWLIKVAGSTISISDWTATAGTYDLWAYTVTYFDYLDGEPLSYFYPETVTVQTAFDEMHPRKAIDSDGDTHIVWMSKRLGQWEIYYKETNSTGNITVPETRISDEPYDSVFPTISLDSFNNAHVIWADYREGNWEIYYSKIQDNTGTDLTSPDWRVSQGDGKDSGRSVQPGYPVDNATTPLFLEHPDIDIDSQNNISIVWSDYRDGNWEIYYQKQTNEATPTTLIDDLSISNLDGNNSQNPVVSAGPDISGDGIPDIHVAWQDLKDGNWEIYYEKLSGTTILVNDKQLTLTDGYDSATPDIDVDNDGYAHLVFMDQRPVDPEHPSENTHLYSPPYWEIYTMALDKTSGNVLMNREGTERYELRQSDMTGGSWWGTYSGTVLGDDPSMYPRIAVAGDYDFGDTYTTWHDHRDGNWEIRYSAAQSWCNNPEEDIKLTDYSGHDMYPDIALNPQREPDIKWQKFEGTRWSIYNARYRGDQWTRVIIDEGTSSEQIHDMYRLDVSDTNAFDGITYVFGGSLMTGSHNYTIQARNYDFTAISRDIAVLSVTPSPTTITQGETVTITAVVKNQGTELEDFIVEACSGDITVAPAQTVNSLAPGDSRTLDFYWNTGGIAPSTYVIKAVASTVPGETDIADNTKIDGSVTVNPPSPVGGAAIPLDKLGLLAPYIGLTSTIIATTIIAAVYVKRRKYKNE